MSLDIVDTLLHALIVEEGLEVGEEFFRDLALTYESIAEEIIKKYSDNAEFNNLELRPRLRGADRLPGALPGHRAWLATTSPLPAHLAEKMLRLTAAHEEFKPYVDQGLQQTILELEEKLREESLEVRHLPSWERILWKLARGVQSQIVDALEEDKQRFK